MSTKPWEDRVHLVANHGEKAAMVEEIDELRSENARLRVALGRAADDIESWGAYASSYFQEKWNLQADIYAARDALGDS